MRTRNATLFSCILLFLMACHVDSVNMPTTDVSASGLKPAFWLDWPCPQGYECEPAVSITGVDANPDTVGTGCAPHVDCGTGGPVHPDSLIREGILTDVSASLDAIYFRCPNGFLASVQSNMPCWECTWGCAGTACPGTGCVTVPNEPGSDCRSVVCRRGWEVDYLWHAEGAYKPRCRRALTTPPPPPGGLASPYTYASVESGNPYLSWDAVAGAAAYRVYRQLSWQAQPEIWYTYLNATSYHDGSTTVYSGSPQSQPDPNWGGTWVRYHVVSLAANGTESSHVNANVHYYHGSGPY